MSKSSPTRRSGQLLFPAISIGGHLSVSVGDRLERGGWRRAPSGEKASRLIPDSRQHPFCNFVSKAVRRIGETPARKDEMVSEGAEFKGATGAQDNAAAFGDRVRSAVIWRSGSQILAQLVTWSVTLVVIRLLDPADYGLFAMTQV